MYIVICYIERKGYNVDKNSRVFKNEDKAREYALKLNMKKADAGMCEIEDLGVYYEVKEIKKEG